MTLADSMYLMYIVSLYLYFIVHMILYIMCLTLRCVNMYIYILFYTKCKRIHCIQYEIKDVNSYPCSFLKPALPVVKKAASASYLRGKNFHGHRNLRRNTVQNTVFWGPERFGDGWKPTVVRLNLGEWTSTPRYFQVNYRGTWFWPTHWGVMAIHAMLRCNWWVVSCQMEIVTNNTLKYHQGPYERMKCGRLPNTHGKCDSK